VAKPPGSLTYTQMLNARGGIECDVTVARLAEDRFYIVTGTGFATHDLDWIARNLPKGADAHLIDMTSAHAVLSLMGPCARDVLAAATRDDLSNAAFPFGQCRRIVVNGAPLWALRVTYVGELGWELHVPMESAHSVYGALLMAGKKHGIADCGYRAIESLRLEKGYRACRPHHCRGCSPASRSRIPASCCSGARPSIATAAAAAGWAAPAGATA
jgi:4-methylaminobutanoate oxidase (formaldehyde-forming)